MSITAETTILNRVDGSATLKVDETKALVSISGPIEPKLRQEQPTTSVLEVIVRADVGASCTREKLLEEKLRSVLSQTIIGALYPRHLIQITAQVLEAGEEKEYTSKELSAIINASYLALVDANIGLNTSFASAVFAITRDDEVMPNPSKEDLKLSKSSHVVALKVENGKATNILLSESIGTFTEEQVLNILDHASIEIERIHQLFRSTIQSKIEKDFIWQL